MLLSHRVQSASVLEPFDLRLIECMCELGLPRLAIFGMDPQRQGLANSELGTHHIDPVVRVDLVVVGGIDECQGKHTLLLKVCLVLQEHLI